MQPFIQNLISTYQQSPVNKKNVLREILQHSILLGLARHNFFEHAALYGETSLRILYGLDKFSEDMDFSLLKPNNNFNLEPFLQGVKTELQSFGFSIEAEIKNQDPLILSAFLKENTLKLLLTIEDKLETLKVHPEEKIHIKLEIDTNLPSGLQIESKIILNPVPFYILSYQLSDLFAVKMHAILCRGWKNRVKGRDWYDLIWFVKNKIPVHLTHLTKRLQQSEHLPLNEVLTHEMLIELLMEKITTINWDLARNDVKPFIIDTKQLDIWSEQFFSDLLINIKTI